MVETNKSSKIVTIAVLAVLFITVIVGGLIINKNKKTVNQLSSEKLMLEGAVQERDSMVNEFITAFDTIESSLTFINQKRGALVLKDSEVTVSQKDAIIKDIQLMNTMLAESSTKIDELEKKLEKSGMDLKFFKNKIASLNKTIEEQNTQIEELKFWFDEQHEKLVSVTTEKDSLQNKVLAFIDTVQVKDNIIEEKEGVISQQTGELNKAFFTFGTSKELADNGVIEKEGGFLGIGKSMTLVDNFNEDYFTKIDITQQQSFDLNAKKVKLISEHPSSSYKLIEKDGLITKLEIETPAEFWKVSHYAIIEVKL